MPSTNTAKRIGSAFWKEPSCAERGPLCSPRPNMGSRKLLTETLASETLWGKDLQEATCTKRGTVPLLRAHWPRPASPPSMLSQEGGPAGSWLERRPESCRALSLSLSQTLGRGTRGQRDRQGRGQGPSKGLSLGGTASPLPRHPGAPEDHFNTLLFPASGSLLFPKRQGVWAQGTAGPARHSETPKMT